MEMKNLVLVRRSENYQFKNAEVVPGCKDYPAGIELEIANQVFHTLKTAPIPTPMSPTFSFATYKPPMVVRLPVETLFWRGKKQHSNAHLCGERIDSGVRIWIDIERCGTFDNLPLTGFLSRCSAKNKKAILDCVKHLNA